MRVNNVRRSAVGSGFGGATTGRRRRAAVCSAAALAGAMLVAPAARAADIQAVLLFAPGDFGSTSTWVGGTVPGTADQADVASGGAPVTISAGESFTVNEAWAGNATNANYGVIQQSGGTLNVNNWLVVGRGGSSGEFDLSGGLVTVTTNQVQMVGIQGNTESAIMRLSGTGSIVMAATDGQPFAVGQGDAAADAGGHLYIQDQASINTGTSQLWVGQDAGSVGAVDMSGGSITVGNWIAIGRNGGVGTFNLSGGVVTKTGGNGSHVTLGSIGGTGTVNMTGGTLNSSGADMYVGETGPGTFILTGGTVTDAATRVAQTAGGIGTLNLSGGTLNTTGIQVGAGNASASSVYFNGTVVRALAASATFVSGFNTSNASVGPGGAIFDVNGFALTAAVGLNGSGGLTVLSSGTGTTGLNGSITLTGANNYAGDTTVNGGTLIIGPNSTLGAGANVNVSSGGMLGIPSDATVAGKNLTIAGNAGILFENYSSALSFANNPQPRPRGRGRGRLDPHRHDQRNRKPDLHRPGPPGPRRQQHLLRRDRHQRRCPGGRQR